MGSAVNKVYLDDNGNPMQQAPTGAPKVYLDESGNPIQQAAPQVQDETPWYRKAPGEIMNQVRLGVDTGKQVLGEAAHEGGRLVEGLAQMGPVGLARAAYQNMKDSYDIGTGKKAAPKLGDTIEDRAAALVNFDKQRFNQNVQRGRYAAAGVNALAPVVEAVAGAKLGTDAGVLPDTPVPKPSAPLRGALAEQMAKTTGDGRFTNAEVNQAARANGINLDVAQATESPTALGAKRANQYSLASQATYDKATKANAAALESWADKNMGELSPDAAPRQSVGPAIQNKLKQNVAEMETQSGRILDQLTKEAGSNQPDARGIYQLADGIVQAEKGYYDKNPNLKPGKAWNIIEKLANRAEETKPQTRLVESSLLDENGKPVMKEVRVKPQVTPDTWSDLHKLRSDLMNEYRSNPEIVGSRAEGWLKQMVAAIDDTMTSEAFSKLSPEQVAKFREANAIYADMKNTYDNPQSPFYHAIRAQSPEQIPAMLTRTPTIAAKAQQVLGSLKGSLQRNYAETILNGKDGMRDFTNLSRRLGNIPDDVLVANLGEKGAQQMRLLGEVARKMGTDSNPSGTAKVGVPAAELGGIFHTPLLTGAELGAQYGGARMMNSPRVVDFLTMKPTEVAKASVRGKRR